MGKVTIYDLARMLNISASTVSRALQNHPRVSLKTKQAVLALAEKMNYHTDPIAHQLRTGKGSVIGVIVPRIDRHFFASVIGGIEQVVHEAGYSVILSQSNEHYEDERAIVKALLSKKIDGIAVSIAAETTQYQHFANAIDRGTPVVFFDRVPTQPIGSCVQIDNYRVSYDAVQHLIAQGCRRIAHLAGPQSLLLYQQRKQGYIEALTDAGIAIDPTLIFDNSITISTGEQVARQLLALPQLPHAVFSAGDYSAMGLMGILKEAGVAIPQEIAVVGFANEIFDPYISPALSSVEVGNRAMGERVAQLLLKEMTTDHELRTPENIVLGSQLIIRDSSRWGGVERN